MLLLPGQHQKLPHCLLHKYLTGTAAASQGTGEVLGGASPAAAITAHSTQETPGSLWIHPTMWPSTVYASRFGKDIQRGELTYPRNANLCMCYLYNLLHNLPALCLSSIHSNAHPNLNYFLIFASFPPIQHTVSALEQATLEKS